MTRLFQTDFDSPIYVEFTAQVGQEDAAELNLDRVEQIGQSPTVPSPVSEQVAAIEAELAIEAMHGEELITARPPAAVVDEILAETPDPIEPLDPLAALEALEVREPPPSSGAAEESVVEVAVLDESIVTATVLDEAIIETFVVEAAKVPDGPVSTDELDEQWDAPPEDVPS